MARKTPQQKKAYSYEKDHRNAYGESDKGSRKAIPLQKTKSRRRIRHFAKLKTRLAGGDDLPEVLEGKIKKLQREAWEKYPDMPLGDFLAHQKEKRKKLVNRKKEVRARWARAMKLAKGDEELAREFNSTGGMPEEKAFYEALERERAEEKGGS